VSRVSITHVGGPTTLIETEGWRILTDPTFDPPGRTYRFGWGTSSRKTSGPAVDAADIGPIDAVLLTHDHHADNLDDAGRALLPAAGVVLTTAIGAQRLGGNARGLAAWDTFELGRPGAPTLTVTATPCRHGPPASRALVGDVIGFAITWEGQQHGALWVSGDTVLYAGLRDVGRRVRVGTAVLHLGRAQFPVTGPVRYTMSATDAIDLCRGLRPRTVVPVHCDAWSHFREGRTEIEPVLAASGDAVGDVVWVTPGRAVTIDA
jgi:L-ascorbate metabolism protein UlaG (beta-lactamase superfamily)